MVCRAAWRARRCRTSPPFYNADVDLQHRALHCVLHGVHYGVAGATLLEYGFNDVYASVNGGATWYNISQTSAWPARCGTSVAATSGGVLALVGGRKPQSYLTTVFPTYYEAVLGYYTLTDIWTSLGWGVHVASDLCHRWTRPSRCDDGRQRIPPRGVRPSDEWRVLLHHQRMPL